jgi:hypothetical protein
MEKDEPADSAGNLNISLKNLLKQKLNDLQRKLKIEMVLLHHCNYSPIAFI